MAPAPRSEPEPGPAPAPQVTRVEYEGDVSCDPGRWDTFTDQLTGPIRSLLRRGAFLETEKHCVKAGFSGVTLRQVTARQGDPSLLEQAKSFFGVPTRFEFIDLSGRAGAPSSPLDQARAVYENKKKEVESEVRQHPVVRRVLDVFPGARIEKIDYLGPEPT